MTPPGPAGGWSPPEIPRHHLLVQPRHLAGGGDILYITGYLKGAGWKQRKRSGPCTFDSPDGTVRIRYAENADPPKWTVSGTGPHDRDAWHATFHTAVPVEILSGFTDAVVAGPRPMAATDVWRPLAAAGWTATGGPHPTGTSPDGTATIRYRRHDAAEDPQRGGDWIAAAAAPVDGGPATQIWDAVITGNSPLHVVEGFAAALADPNPVLRAPGDVPFAAAQHVTTTPYPVLPSQLAGWYAQRVAAGSDAAGRRNATGQTARPPGAVRVPRLPGKPGFGRRT